MVQTTTKNMLKEIFEEEFYVVTTPISNPLYYSVTYTNSDNTICVQSICYSKASATLEPTASLISPSLKANSEGKSLNTTKLTGTSTIKGPSVIVLIRYDSISQVTGKMESILRISASQIVLGATG